MARTGSGKTAAFLIPMLEKLLASPRPEHGTSTRGLILSPTRELSMQTLRVLNKLASETDIRAIGIHGGEGMEKQFNLLATKPDVIVATPGRLAHHVSEIPDFSLSNCQIAVLDEADRLMEMGFGDQIRQIARSMPETCQRLLFSATMPKMLLEFTKSGFCTDPRVVRLDNEATVSEELRMAFLTCRSLDKDAVLLHVLEQIRRDQESHKESRTGLTLIFCATRHHCEYLTTLVNAAAVGSDPVATQIYGTMDQEARKANLAAFRSGKQPVLVVTDVAARGIDVPLIDHVVHYHFPPSPKLFVHRSGRAARAGRIGYCWGLVEPDELAYMIDLHLFLGRKPSTGHKDKDELMYSLHEMTPEMVHYGSVPESILTGEVENVQRIFNSELSGSLEAETLRALTKVCKNAMKQYRRTRVEASKEGIRRGKAILEGERLETGQRLGSGAIAPHPLLLSIERDRQKGATGLGGLENSLQREDFLRAMSNFRPKETVFEAFATGGGKEMGVVSHVDKGRTTSKNKNDSSAALAAMKNMRRQMRMARDKGSTLMVAGSSICETANGEAPEKVEDDVDPTANEQSVPAALQSPQVAPTHTKRRLTKAERRRLKKDPSAAPTARVTSSEAKVNKPKRRSDFRDPTFYIDNDFTSNTEEAQRSRQIEAAMQPSSSSSAKGSMGTALRIEETLLDLVGDENEDMVKKQRMMRWDKAKRKYVKTTVGSELSGESKSKKLRLESGQLVKSEKLKLGELYEKWQKKTNRSVGRTGVFDDGDGAAPLPEKKKKCKKSPSRDDEVKSISTIKKERAKKQNMALKNMKKNERRSIEQKKKESKAYSAKKASNKFQGKSKNRR